jgi:hypothetical protein
LQVAPFQRTASAVACDRPPSERTRPRSVATRLRTHHASLRRDAARPPAHEIGRVVNRFDNFHETDDETLTGQYEFAEWDDALGSSGIESDAPENYADHDVSYVDTHETYFLDDGGCADAVVDTW